MDEIKLLNLNQLHDFANHPFKVEENTELCELMRSIETGSSCSTSSKTESQRRRL